MFIFYICATENTLNINLDYIKGHGHDPSKKINNVFVFDIYNASVRQFFWSSKTWVSVFELEAWYRAHNSPLCKQTSGHVSVYIWNFAWKSQFKA